MKIKILLLYLFIVLVNSLVNNCYSQFSLTSINCNPNPIPRNNYITVTTTVHNNGSSDYYDFEADFDDVSGGYLTVVNKQCSKYIAAGSDATIQFTSNSPIDFAPNQYKIYIKAFRSSCFSCGAGSCTNLMSSAAFVSVSIITQSVCTNWSATPSNVQVLASGGSGTFAVNSSSSCSFTASSTYSWINNISYPMQGTVSYHVDANGNSARQGTIEIKDVNLVTQAVFTINQYGGSSGCTSPTLNQPTVVSSSEIDLSWINSGNASSYTVYYSSQGCYLSATSLNTSSTSLQITGLSANTIYSFWVVGNNCSTNSNCVQATTQSSGACTYSLYPPNKSYDQSNYSAFFNVNTSSGCQWSASSSDDTWLHTNSTGNGPGTCSYIVDANTGGDRTGYIYVQDKTFTVFQSGSGISQEPSANFGADFQVINAGQIVHFTDLSSNTPTQWTWTFPGGTADNVNIPNPTVIYNAPGTYRVSLHVANSFGADDATYIGYINVKPTAISQLKAPQNYYTGNQNRQYPIAEPILTGTGTYRYRHIDFNVPFLDMPLAFTRTYNSSDHLQNGNIGYGWSFSYNYYIQNEQDTLWDVHYPDGHTATFVPEYGGNGASFALYAGTFDTLSKTNNEFTLTTNDNKTYLFDLEGKLTQIADRNNNTTTLIYNGESLEKIQTSSGRELDISYNSNNYISSVNTPTGLICYFVYDSNGNLISFQDQNNNKTSYTYDSSHQLLSLIDPNGDTVLTNVYDTESRIIKQGDAYNKITSIAYDSPKQGDATIAYPDNSYEIVHHDSLYRETQIKDALGYTKYYAYDSNNNRISIINENNEQETRQYDSKGNLLNQTLAGDRSTNIHYNSFNEPTYKQDANGDITTYDYDDKGNLLTIHYPDNSTRSYNYNSDGTVNNYTDGRGNVTSYSYSSYKDLVGITKGNTTKSFVYYEDGRLKYQIDENNNTTTFTYDGDGNLIKKKDALDQNEQFVYDSSNRQIAYIDKKGLATKYSYDKEGRMITRTNALNGVMSYAYDERDNLKSVTDANGNVFSYTYDAKGRKKSKTNALGTTYYDYDGTGNLMKETDANQKSTSYTYVNSNKLESITNAVGSVTKFGYDNNSNLISTTDALGNVTQYKYDAMNRLINVTDAENKITTIVYDANGNRQSITDPNQHTRSYSYDPLDRLTDYLDAANNNIHYDYDNAGNLIKITKPTGTITKSYDEINRVDTVVNSTGDTYIFNYDEDNDIVSMSNNEGSSSFKYDSVRRMIQYTNPFSKQVSFEYDPAGNKTSINYPGNLQVKYSYDKVNNIASVTDWLNHVFNYTYDPDNRLASLKYPNNITCSYKYDDAGQLVEKKNLLANGTVLTSSDFTLDAIGNRIKEERTGPQPSNLLPASFSYKYKDDNELVFDSIATYVNDNSGNRLSQFSDGDTIKFSFSVDNLLEGFSDRNNTATFEYDPEGNRMSRTKSNVTSNYILDISNSLSKVLQVTDGSGNLNANYIYGNGLLESIDASNNALYYHFDAAHNTVAITTDQNDYIRMTYSYDPFGSLLNNPGEFHQPFLFLGEYGVEHEDSALYYVRARYYDAGNGRFLSKDVYPFDLNNPQTLNEYVYAMDNPIIRYDGNGFHGNVDWDNIESAIDIAKEYLDENNKFIGFYNGDFKVWSNDFFGNQYVSSSLVQDEKTVFHGAEDLWDGVTSVFALPAFYNTTKSTIDDYMNYKISGFNAWTKITYSAANVLLPINFAYKTGSYIGKIAYGVTTDLQNSYLNGINWLGDKFYSLTGF